MRFIVKHWKGENSLAFAYWVNFFALGLLVVFASSSITEFIWSDASLSNIGYRTACSVTVLLDALFLVVYVWQVVGTWRSAEKHVNRAGRLWVAGLVKMLVFLGILLTAGRYYSDSDVYVELWRGVVGANMQRPEVSVYGDTLLVDGMLASGTAKRAETALEGRPNVSALWIRSDGGYFYEANAIARLVRRKSLGVVADDRCLSACVLVLAAGEPRLVTDVATIGLHQGSAFGRPFEDEQVWTPLLEAGFPEDELRRAMRAPPGDMWTIGIEKLVLSGFVQSIEHSGRRFLSSSPGLASVPLATGGKREKVRDALLVNDFFSGFYGFDPVAGEKVVVRLASEITGAATIETMHEKAFDIGSDLLAGPLLEAIPLADDAALVRFANALVDALSDMSSEGCYAYLMDGSSSVATRAYRALSNHQKQELLSAMGAVFSSASEAIDDLEVASDDDFLRLLLLLDESELLAIVEEEHPEAEARAAYCSGVIRMYTLILEGEPAERGPALRLAFTAE